MMNCGYTDSDIEEEVERMKKGIFPEQIVSKVPGTSQKLIKKTRPSIKVRKRLMITPRKNIDTFKKDVKV